MKKLLLGVCLLNSLTFAAKIEVVGQGVVKTAPNVIQTNLGIQTQKETVQDAMETNQKLISSLYEKLIALGIEKKDIVTSQFYLNYYKNEDKKDVYTVSNNLEIKIRDLKKINDVLSISTKEGVNNIWGINFVADGNDDLAKKARIAAIENAKLKATEYAKAAGMKITGIIEISEIQNTNYGFVGMAKSKSFNDSAVYGPEELEFTDSIKVIYEMK